MSRTLKLVLAYDGTNYAGWQRQANAIGIQQIIEDEIAAIVGTHNPLIAAGRTDAGVHAAGQVASITIDHAIGCDELMRALNARIKGGEIRIRSIEEAPAGWNARNLAVSKTYRYAIWNGPPPSPFFRHVVWHVPHPLEIDRMRRAASALVGEHDFVAFQGSGSDVITTIRRVIAADIVDVNPQADRPSMLSPTDGAPEGGRLLRVEITGTGFLRHMVRTIAGTLVDIGRGAMPPDAMREIIASGDRARTGQTAPARGLMLWEVHY
jgi:tRNA pseudouridine38-40 synthase